MKKCIVKIPFVNIYDSKNHELNEELVLEDSRAVELAALNLISIVDQLDKDNHEEETPESDHEEETPESDHEKETPESDHEEETPENDHEEETPENDHEKETHKKSKKTKK